MTKKELEEDLYRESFKPFRINTADGKSYPVENSRLAVPTDTRVFPAFPKGGWTFVVLRHVTSIGSLHAA
jgi:hypothetical protein